MGELNTPGIIPPEHNPELAFLLNVFGSKVTVAVSSSRILPDEDHDTSQRITQAHGRQINAEVPRLDVPQQSPAVQQSVFASGVFAILEAADIPADIVRRHSPSSDWWRSCRSSDRRPN